jgi:cytochrome c nitrite reductase small subunit
MRDQFDGWQKGSHHAVANCNDCHIPHDPINKWIVKAENGYLHSKAFTFEDFHEPIQMRDSSHQVLVANCTDCHYAMVENIVAQNTNESQSLDCVRCHRDVGHGPTK